MLAAQEIERGKEEFREVSQDVKDSESNDLVKRSDSTIEVQCPFRKN